MDVRRPFYREYGNAVVNIVIPFGLGLFHLIIITVDMLEWCCLKIFGRLNKQRIDAPEVNVNEQPAPEMEPRFDLGNRINERHLVQQRSQVNVQQAQARNSENDRAQQILNLLENGDVDNIQQAKIVFKLLSLQFSRVEAIDAARNCTTVDSAIAYLNQECEACNQNYPMSKMIYMLNCTHRCCRTCAKNFFSLQITHHSVTDCVCPYCRLPDLRSEHTSAYQIKQYFANLSIILGNVLTANMYKVFQNKLNLYLVSFSSEFPNANIDEEKSLAESDNGQEEEEEEEEECREEQVISNKRNTNRLPVFITERLQQSTPPRAQPKKPTEFDLMEHKALTLLQEGKVQEFPQAELAVSLMSMQFNESDSIDASRNCRTLDNAISYLQQECRICDNNYPMSQMFSMLNCEHRICRPCAKNHFTEKITDHDISDCICPTCQSPNLGDEEMAEDDVSTYLSNMDIVLKDLLDAAVYEQLQQKLRDFALRNDANESTSLSATLQKQAQQFVVDGRVVNYMQSELAIRLIEADYSESDALEAVKHCSTLNGAVAFLDQECELCADKFRINQMVTMLSCAHRCCVECAKNYFNEQINERTIFDCNCPFCSIPNLNDEEMPEADKNYYFSNLDILLKNILEAPIHEVFQKKLRDWSLAMNSNFKWCPQCSSGYITEGGEERVTCPDCRAITCVNCRKPWEDQHAGISCARFAEWKVANDPELQETGLANHLATNGIDCPKCKHRFSLARGGCMHFTCTQCKHEFCQGCAKPFSRSCSVRDCRVGGLHAHHPRNCLYFLRDRDPEELQGLLTTYNVPFNTARPSNAPNTPTCSAILSSSGRMTETYCGGTAQQGHAGLCRVHYIEYLAGLIKANRIDPIDVLDVPYMTYEMKRRGIEVPKHDPATTSPEAYKETCAKIIRNQIPLEEKTG